MLTTAPLLARLPAPMQAKLREVGASCRNMIGRLRPAQDIIADHAALLQALKAGGLTHADIARLLAEVGIVRGDGTPVPEGTVSSALCRARKRGRSHGAATATAAPGHALQRAAETRAAEHCNALQAVAVECDAAPCPALTVEALPDPALPCPAEPRTRAPRPARPRSRHRGAAASAAANSPSVVAPIAAGRDRQPVEGDGHDETELDGEAIPASTLKTALLLNRLRSKR